MERLPKRIEWQLKQLVGQAYENELSQELGRLAAQVDEWRAKRLKASELAQLIHEADTGRLRDLHKGYDTPYHKVLVAGALQRGLLQESDVPDEMWPYLQNAMAFWKDHLGEDDVDDD